MSELEPETVVSAANPDRIAGTPKLKSIPSRVPPNRYQLGVAERLEGKRLLVIGGNGFVGKVFLSLLLKEFPDVERIYLLLRARDDTAAEMRLRSSVLESPVFDPIREEYGSGFEAFCARKFEPVVGDVSEIDCGIGAARVGELRGKVDAIVNISGVIDFFPALDHAVGVNALGGQRAAELARDLGNLPLLHTSTCYVAGSRDGIVGEENPTHVPPRREAPPFSESWDAEREMGECLALVFTERTRLEQRDERARAIESERALRRSRFRESISPISDDALFDKALRRALVEAGANRAKSWGFSNSYTYTKALGEHLVARAGIPFTIVRPAVVESAVRYPFPGWNEGANTSAPVIYLVREGGMQVPASRHSVDIIPCDLVASGMILALAELLEGTAPAVYQLGTSDCNPSTARSFMKLATQYRRRYHLARDELNWITRWLKVIPGVALLSERQFWSFGPPAIATWAGALKVGLERIPAGALFGVADRWALALGRFAQRQQMVARVLEAFLPFVARHDYRFTSAHVRAAYARLTLEERRKLQWNPESIDWSRWFFDVHVKGLEQWVFPALEANRRASRHRARSEGQRSEV